MTRLEKERDAAKLTQFELARLARVSQSTICKLEKRKMKRPTFEVLARLADALSKFGSEVQAKDLSLRQPVVVVGAQRQKRRHRRTRNRKLTA
jgi:transcriptional regulator with XRE-family HTH domain